jgi:hypothetical protein
MTMMETVKLFGIISLIKGRWLYIIGTRFASVLIMDANILLGL